MLANALPGRAIFSSFPDSSVQRTLHADARFVEDMRINHRRAHVFVTEKFLHCADVVTTLQQVSSEGVTQTVTVGPFYYSRCVDRFLGERSAIFPRRCDVAVYCRCADRTRSVKRERRIARPTREPRLETFDSERREDARCQIHLRDLARAALSPETNAGAAVRPGSAEAS